MREAQVGIIGGTGLSDVLLREAAGETVSIETPFGPPSSSPILARWEGVDVAFLLRHGPGHLLNPSQVPYRANIWALKRLGVTAIVASGATGSLRQEIEPGDLVICDQVIDRTYRAGRTFFEEGLAVHVEFSDPFCPRLRALLIEAGDSVETRVHPAGAYVCMEGPQFSTRAESQLHRQWGADLIGMTCMPEAKLAREAEICYALVALPTDYDCWRPPVAASDSPAVDAPEQEELLRVILGNLQTAGENAVALIRRGLQLMVAGGGAAAPTPTGKGPGTTACRCRDALKLAIWSDKKRIDPAVRTRLGLLIDRYLREAGAP